MTTLHQDLSLQPALQALRELGAAHIDKALDAAFLRELQHEADGMPFKRMPAEEGRARQGGEQFQLAEHAMPNFPAIRQLGHALTDRVQRDGANIPGCSAWTPNEVYVQRYGAGDLGITPHLDLKRYRCLVAIFTAEGAAPFMVCKNREGDPLITWTAARGSLVLLRAPGFDDNDQGRPLHAVGGPASGQRLSISYRMDASQPR